MVVSRFALGCLLYISGSLDGLRSLTDLLID